METESTSTQSHFNDIPKLFKYRIVYLYIYIFIAGLKKCKNWTGIWKINLDLILYFLGWIGLPLAKVRLNLVLFVDPTVFTYTMNEFDNVSIYLKSCVDINVHSKQAVSS